MKTQDIYRQPGHLLRRAHQWATAAFMIETRTIDTTPVQYSALIVIKDFPGIDATRVSELIFYDRTTIGHVIGRLETKGLVIREPGNGDKRTKQIFITPAGEEALRKVTTVLPEISDRILGTLSKSDQETLLRILTRLLASTAGEGPDADRVRAKIGENA